MKLAVNLCYLTISKLKGIDHKIVNIVKKRLV
jgi:hypothetical protein